MASVSNTVYSSITANNKGVGGMLSGLDTEELIEQLLTGTRSKIAKQGQKKQTLQWQQTAYRGIAGALRTFKSAFTVFDDTNKKDSLYMKSTFEKLKANLNSDKIKVDTSKSTPGANLTIDEIKSLATAQKLVSDKGSMKMEVDIQGYAEAGSVSAFENYLRGFAGEKLNIQMDNGKIYEIDLQCIADMETDLVNFPGGITTITAADVAQTLQDAINDVVGFRDKANTDPMIEVKPVAGKFELDGKANRLTVTAACTPLNLTTNQTTRINGDAKLKDIAPFAGLSSELVFKLNGTTIRANSDMTLNELVKTINDSGTDVTAEFNQITGEITFIAGTLGYGNNLSFEDVQGNLFATIIGTASGSSYTSSASNLSNTYRDIINGGSIGTGSDPDLVSAFYGMFVTQTSGETVSLSFDLEVGGWWDSVTQTMRDSTTYTIELELTWDEFDALGDPTDPDPAVQSAFAAALRNTLNSKLLSETYSQGLYAKGITIGISQDYNHLMIYTPDDLAVSIATSSVTSGPADQYVNLYNLFGFNTAGTTDPVNGDLLTTSNYQNHDGTVLYMESTLLGEISNLLDLDTSHSRPITGTYTFDITVGGTTQAVTINLTYDDDLGTTPPVPTGTTIQDVLEQINRQFGGEVAKLVNGKLVLDGDGQQVGFKDTAGDFMETLFGTSELQITSGLGWEDQLVDGTNATIVIDGQDYSQTDNTFDINGVTFEITAETVANKDDLPITISTEIDVDAIYDVISNFIDEYNSLVTLLTGTVNEEKSKGYAPLTDEQKAEMTEKEIELWETEAQKGILRNDSTIRKIISDLRAVFYTSVDAAGFSASYIGINTAKLLDSGNSLDMSKSGILEINEDVLRAAITENPEEIAMLFSDNTDGIAKRISTIVDAAANESTGSHGSLVYLAGSETITGDNYNIIDARIESIDKTIARLKATLEKEYTRYWRQFSRLEVALQNLNTQSGWLNDYYSS